jgi:hypothetical protein
VSLRNKLAERVRPYLQPGERIQAVFPAQSGPPPYWQSLITGFVVFIAFLIKDAVNGLMAVLTVAVAVSAALYSVYLAYLVFGRARLVVVTDRAIVVLDVNKWTGRPTRLRLRHSRDFYFGQLSGLWGKFVLDNAEYWVHRRFHGDVAAADAALTQMTQR